jgi:hypothetical protein
MNRYRPDPEREALKTEARLLHDSLAARIRGKALVCEIDGFGSELHVQLRDLVKRLHDKGFMQDHDHLWPHRCVHLVWLVLEGVFNYTAGNLWDNTSLGPLNHDFRNKLSKLFEETIKIHRLEGSGIDLPKGGPRVLTRILFHGGMPASAADDYFRLLIASTTSHATTGDDLVGKWRANPKLLDKLDLPTQRFLLNAGRVSVDFVDRTLDFLRLAAESDRQDLEQVAIRTGIPVHLVSAYDVVRKSVLPRVVVRSTSRLPRPHLELDPYSGEGPVLRFPSIAHANGQGWRIASGDEHQRIGAMMYEQTVSVSPATAWCIEYLNGNDKTEDVFHIAGVREANVLLFDSSSFQRIEPTQRLRNPQVYVLHQRNQPLSGTVNQKSALLPVFESDLPLPRGAWSDFMVSAVDVSGFTDLRAGSGEPFRLLMPSHGVSLDAVDLVPGVTSDSGPVYSEIPRILGTEDGGKFRGEITVNGHSTPVNDALFALFGAELLRHVAQPAGAHRFTVKLRAGLGRDLRIAFLVVPNLKVDWTLPDEQLTVTNSTIPPATLRVAIHGTESPAIEVPQGERPQSDESIQVPGNSDLKLRIQVPAVLWSFTIEVPLGERAQSDVSIQVPGNSDLELRIQVPAVLWSFTTVDKTPALSQRIARFGAHEFTSGRVSHLAVSTGEGDRPYAVRLSTLEGQLISQRALGAKASQDGRWVADLRPFSDAIRQTNESALLLELACTRRNQHVALIVAALNATQLNIVPRVHGLDVHLTAEWKEELPLPNRRIRLWNLSRPWTPAVDKAVPSDATGTISWNASLDEMPPGEWFAVIGIEDKWQTLPVHPSKADLTNGTTFTIGTLEDTREWVRRLPPGGRAELERVCLGLPALDTSADTVESLLPDAVHALQQRLANWQFDDFRTTRELRRFIAAAYPDSADAISRVLGTQRTTSSSEAVRVGILLSGSLAWELAHAGGNSLPPIPTSAMWEQCPIIAAAVFGERRLTSELRALLELDCGLDVTQDAWPRTADIKGFNHLNTLVYQPQQLPELRRFLMQSPKGLLSANAEDIDVIDWMIDYAAGRLPVSQWIQRYKLLVEQVHVLPHPFVANRIEAVRDQLGMFHHGWFTVTLFAACLHAAFGSNLSDRGRMALLDAASFAPTITESFLVRAYMVRWLDRR